MLANYITDRAKSGSEPKDEFLDSIRAIIEERLCSDGITINAEPDKHKLFISASFRVDKQNLNELESTARYMEMYFDAAYRNVTTAVRTLQLSTVDHVKVTRHYDALVRHLVYTLKLYYVPLNSRHVCEGVGVPRRSRSWWRSLQEKEQTQQ